MNPDKIYKYNLNLSNSKIEHYLAALNHSKNRLRKEIKTFWNIQGMFDELSDELDNLEDVQDFFRTLLNSHRSN